MVVEAGPGLEMAVLELCLGQAVEACWLSCLVQMPASHCYHGIWATWASAGK